MTDTDVIEAINFEQLATMTDRLLLRHGHRQHRQLPAGAMPAPARRVPADRFSVPSLVAAKRALWPSARVESTVHGYHVSGPRGLARGSQPSLQPTAVPAHAFALDEHTDEKTIVVRRPRAPVAAPAHSRLHWLAVTVVIPALLGTIVGLLMLL